MMPVMVMMVKPTRVQGRTELDTLDMGCFFMKTPARRRSIQKRVPTESDKASTCVPSTIGNIQMDSRRLVPKLVSWSHWHISRMDINDQTFRTTAGYGQDEYKTII